MGEHTYATNTTTNCYLATEASLQVLLPRYCTIQELCDNGATMFSFEDCVVLTRGVSNGHSPKTAVHAKRERPQTPPEHVQSQECTGIENQTADLEQTTAVELLGLGKLC